MKTLGLLGLLLISAGCGGPSADTACADLANARCMQLASCTNGAGVTRDYGDLATCLMREKLSCSDALAAKGTGNSPSAAESCAKAIPAESCADFFAGNAPASCVHVGTLADGTACAFPGQCVSTYCTNEKNAACGVCGAAPATGGDCSTTGCARGQSCVTVGGSNMTTTSTCVVEGTQGASCDRAQPCAAGLSCVGATLTAMGTCMPAGATVGASCDATARTAPGCASDLGLWCNATTKMCTAVTFAAAGAACGEGTDGNLTSCAAGGVCVGATFGRTPTMGTCKAPAADGQACDTAMGPDCLAPARCLTGSGTTAGTCTLADASKC